MGEIIYGDGGGSNGEATDTGASYPCDVCDGTGYGGLFVVAMKAVKETL
jgi:hypothetical protein